MVQEWDEVLVHYFTIDCLALPLVLGVLTPLYTNAVRVSVLQRFLIYLHFVLQVLRNQFLL